MTAVDPLSEIPATPSGDDFEDFFWGLLARRYPPEAIVYIPADMGGDKGIEGYTTDGIAYQCYADKDSLSLRARTDKQKKKLYDDTEKIRKYASDLPKLLDGMVVRHYFLVVPQFHAAELVEYANKRADVVRAWDLPFISEDFAVRIKTLQDYPAEYHAALHDGSSKALLPEPHVDDEAVEGFADDEPELAATLVAKLRKLKAHHAAADVEAMSHQLTKAYLAKEELMEALQAWPQTREAVERQRRLRQEVLEFENGLAIEAPHSRVANVAKEYAADLRDTVAGLAAADAQRLSFGQIGDWLMRCPLEFQDAP
ncbi:hypothetical protein [Nocardioides jiangxiensis]|uniref:Restriction endonuclease n=1 Tax=Nocardioides jiangxiensis TaxID=3064524 RepID=A0ABT9B1N9_9ACTN|nr:hypothetical protein [Nocardioides sp. WY-20]MDO7868153.1 hypothetical protein [Nocardioides sp. WY-20]